MKAREVQILRFLLAQNITHYHNIAEATGLSKRTVASYLDWIETDLIPLNLKLQRKPNVGIWLEGSATAKEKLVNSLESHSGIVAPEARIHYLEIKLLMTDRSYTLQELADDLFVSRRTIDTDFRQAKAAFEAFDIEINTSHSGVAIHATEQQRRKMLSKLLQGYWGGNVVVTKSHQGALKQRIQLPSYVEDFFSQDLVNQIMDLLTEFSTQGELAFSDYDFQSLAIHIIIAYERTENHHAETQHYAPGILNETHQLIVLLHAKLQWSIDFPEQWQFNAHMLAARNRLPEAQDSLISAGRDDHLLRRLLNEWLADIHPDARLLQDLDVHLDSALTRLQEGLSIPNPYASEIKRNLPMAYDRALQLGAQIHDQLQLQLNDDEVCYLALHFESFFERRPSPGRINTVVVCTSGIGTSRLLAQRLEERFRRELHITQTIGLSSLLQGQAHGAELIISTISIQGLNQPVVVVNPLLPEADVRQVVKQVEVILDGSKANTLTSLIETNAIIFAKDTHSWQTTIKTMVKQLSDLNTFTADANPAAVAISREQLASTAMNRVAIPHIPTELVQAPRIGVYLAPNGINWRGNSVNVIFFLALTKAATENSKPLYASLNQIIDDSDFCLRLAAIRTPATVLQAIQNYSQKETSNLE